MARYGRKIQFIILFSLICLVSTISIAYAVLSTTLNIIGVSQVMNASWDVHFDNIKVNPGSVFVDPKIIDNDKISFAANLDEPGDFYKFTVDIVNDGSIDAMIESIIKSPDLSQDQKKFLKYEVEYIDGAPINESQLLRSNEVKTISILVSFRNDIPVSELPTTDTELDIEIKFVYVQATDSGTDIPVAEEKLIRFVNGDINTVGSEACIGDECFYLVKVNNNNNAVLLSKYNLYVGRDWDGEQSYFYGDEATGIQHPDMRGYIGSGKMRRGVDVFTWTLYWGSYTDTYPARVLNEKSEFYKYLVFYKSYLEGLGANIEHVRLITQEELVELGCSEENSTCNTSNYSWVSYTSYWTESAANAEQMWTVFYGGFYPKNPGTVNGVRPVVEISSSYFN